MNNTKAVYTCILLMLSGSSQAATGLVDVYRDAERNDPRLRAIEAQYLATAEGKAQARAQLLPQIGGNANLTRVRQEVDSEGLLASGTDYYTTKGFSLDLTQPIYRRDRLVQRRIADALTEQAGATLEAERQDLIQRVASSYFGVLAAQDALAFARAEREAIARQLDQAKQRFDVGLVAITDVHEAQAAFDLAVADQIEAERALNAAREALREITGQYYEDLELLRADIPLATPTPTDVQTWVDAALDRNPSVEAAGYGVEASRQRIDFNRASHSPVVNAVASHGYTDIGGGSFGGRETTDTSLGLQVNVPIYQGGGVNSRVREAEHRFDQSSQELEQQRRRVVRQTRDAFWGVNSAVSRVQALRQAVVSNESSLEAAQAGLEVGTRTLVDVLTAQSLLFRARSEYARARYDYLLAGLRLKQAAGALSMGELQSIAQLLADLPGDTSLPTGIPAPP